MNLRYVTCFFIAFSFTAVKANDGAPFQLNGKLPGVNGQYIYLAYENGDKYLLDSTLVKNGAFIFKGKIPNPVMATLYTDRAKAMYGMGDMANFFIEPGILNVQLKKGNLQDAVLTGSKTQADYLELKKMKAQVDKNLIPLSKQYNELNDEYINAIRAKKDSATLEGYKDKLEAIRDKMEPYYEKSNAIEEEFIKTHPGSYVSGYLLRYKISRYPYEKGLAIFNGLSKPVQESTYGRGMKKELDGLKMGSPGSVAHVFTKTDINGEQLSLADYKGKYVLLDFWASWCVPCRKGNPHLLKIYSKYKNKGFEIIGVSDDDSKPEAWKKAVAQDGIGVWKHVLRGLDMEKRMKNEPNPEDLSDYYGIHSLPTKILIDPSGMIIGRYGEGRDDDSALDVKLEAAFTPNVTIIGDIKGLQAGEVVYIEALGNKERDSVIATDNKFIAHINVPEGMGNQYLLQIGKGYKGNNLTMVYLDSGTLYIKGNGPWFEGAESSGTKVIDEMKAMREEIKKYPGLENMDSLYKLANKLYAARDTNALKALNPQLEKIRSAREAFDKKWIENHPASVTSTELISNNSYTWGEEETERLFNTLSPEAKNNAIAKKLQYSIDVNKATAIGKMALDFTQDDTLGNPVSLKDFRGKYVFVDFWASWCVPCRAENPNVVKAFQQYKGKNFTILGVSLDNPGKKDLWLKAINKDGLTWTHVSDLKGWDNAVAKQYNIRAIPANLLIDPTGKIIAKDLHGEELSKKLAAILN